MNYGGLNKKTNKYVLPDNASKEEEYICPDCLKKLVLCKGEIKRAYFRHKVDKKEPCGYYTNPGESQIHKEAKLRMKYLLETKKIKIKRYCAGCEKNKIYKISEKKKGYEVKIEYRFEYKKRKKYADIGYVDKDGKLIGIFEICNKNKTKSENRPEPWYEFGAEYILSIDKEGEKRIELKCIRDKKCKKCINMEKLKKNDLEKYVRIKLGQDFKKGKDYSRGGWGLVIDRVKHESLNKKEKGKYRPDHERLNFHADDDEYFNENNKLCEIFKNDFNTNRVVIYSKKGWLGAFIISNKDFKKYGYLRSWDVGLDGSKMEYPYLYYNEYSGYGTVKIFMDLIRKSEDYIPINECQYVEKSKRRDILWRSLIKKKYLDKRVEKDGKIKGVDMINRDNIVIQIQNKSISEDKIKEKEDINENMIWIINCLDIIDERKRYGKDKLIEKSIIILTTENNYTVITFSTKYWKKMKNKKYMDTGKCMYEIIKEIRRNYFICRKIEYVDFLKKYCRKILNKKRKEAKDILYSVIPNREYSCGWLGEPLLKVVGYNGNEEPIKNLNYCEETDTFYGDTYDMRQCFYKLGYRYNRGSKKWENRN